MTLLADMCLHPILRVRKAASREHFFKNMCSKYALDIPLFSGRLCLGWNESAFFISVEIPKAPSFSVAWPQYRSGDAVELYIDTKGLRSFRLCHRYCHQIVLLPEAIEGLVSREVTSFRSGESRALMRDNAIRPQIIESGSSLYLAAEIPQELLFGWTPEASSKMGFAISLHSRSKNPPASASFPIGEQAVAFEAVPHRWATLILG